MGWSGSMHLGDSWAAFRGRTTENSLHAHAALQVCLGGSEAPVLEGPSGDRVSGPVLLVRPGALHALYPIALVTLIFVEPQTPLARYLLQHAGAEPLSLLPEAIAGQFDAVGPLPDCLRGLVLPPASEQPRLDGRVAAALAALLEDSRPDAIARAALAMGLSDSRLRALARKHLGGSLTNWLTWRKLEAAGRALAGGATLADAAGAGGFADQAHFSRAMRRVFGITPGMAGSVLR